MDARHDPPFVFPAGQILRGSYYTAAPARTFYSIKDILPACCRYAFILLLALGFSLKSHGQEQAVEYTG